MKKTLLVVIIIVISTVFVSSCSLPGSANSFTYLRKGTPYSQIFDSYIRDTTHYPAYTFEYENQKYQVLIYYVVNRVHKDMAASNNHKQFNGGYDNKGKYKSPEISGLQPQRQNLIYNDHDPFYFIFKDNALYTWGYLYEIKNDPSDRISQFGNAIDEGYKRYLASKGEEYER